MKMTEEAEAIAADQPMLHKNLAPALVAALADLTVVEAARTASIPTKDGKSYSYKYADITDAVKVTRPVLAKHGLVALTPVHAFGNRLACTVKILHTSGESMDLGPFPFDEGRDAQATGSAVTYHRRYSLIAALGMAAGDDDDGAAAKAGRRPEQIVWNVGMVKADLLNLCDGDKDKAAKVWADLGAGASAHGWGAGVAALLLDEWEHLPADGEPVPA